jgi:hypothetical protein
MEERNWKEKRGKADTALSWSFTSDSYRGIPTRSSSGLPTKGTFKQHFLLPCTVCHVGTTRPPLLPALRKSSLSSGRHVTATESSGETPFRTVEWGRNCKKRFTEWNLWLLWPWTLKSLFWFVTLCVQI